MPLPKNKFNYINLLIFNLKLLIVSLFALSILGCFHIEPFHISIVKDSESNVPLENVEVYLELDETCYLLHGGGRGVYERIEAHTNKSGVFFLPIDIEPYLPFMCFVAETFYFSKAGYYPKETTNVLTNIHLDRWKHRLDAINYNYQYAAADYYLYKSRPYVPIEKYGYIASDEEGIFYRKKDAQFTTIYESYYQLGGINFYDAKSEKWILLDERGDETGKKYKFMPQNFKYIGSTLLFADDNKIFIQKGTEKRNVIEINAEKGNISSIAGETISNFFTIEDEGSFLCHYGKSNTLKRYYSEKYTDYFAGTNLLHTYDKTYLPVDLNDTMMQQIKFIKIYNYRGEFYAIYLLLTKTPENWYIYEINTLGEWDNLDFEFKEVASFPINKKILALSQGLYPYPLFISFENEGIRKFDLSENKLVEDKSFFEASKDSTIKNFKDLLYNGIASHDYVYALAGDDKIYRFSDKGLPDYRVKLRDGLDAVLDCQLIEAKQPEEIRILYVPQMDNNRSQPNNLVSSPKKTKSEN